MNHREIDAVVAGLVPVVREFQIKSMEGLVGRVGVIEQRAPMVGEVGPPGPPGENGKSVTLDDVHPLIAEAVAGLPLPQDGKDADPAFIELLVEDAVAKIPPAPAGKDADPIEIANLVVAEVQKAVSEIPRPRDGKDIDPSAIKLMVEEEVAKVPPASDGKSVTVDDVRPLIEELVASLPKPADGKDADPDFIKLMVAEEVAKVPLASDGKSVTLDDVRPLIDEAVGKIPKPQDGKSVHPDELAALIQQEVAKLPPAPPGKDVDPALLQRMVAALAGFETQIKSLSDEIKTLRALPVAPASFLINEDGVLLSVYPDGSTKSIGRARGEDGERGASIMDGSIDDTGHLILRMSDGRILNAGVVRGADGKDGLIGGVGRPGRDAIEIQPIPGIDESKSYAEGVYVRYRGGIIRSERQTDPIENDDIAKAGWGTVLRGIAEEVEHVLDDGRFIERITTYTDGTTLTRRTQTVMPIYRGPWKDGTYQRGDIATRGGGLWHCERETTGAPTASEDWKLAVKKGQDGKDGKPGSKGQDGRNGRDWGGQST